MSIYNSSKLADERTKILDASEALFRKYGIRSVTMLDIAKSLGMSKKTLYVYIKNKQDLVHQLIKRFLVEDEAFCRQAIEQASNALEALLQMSLYAQQQINKVNPSLLHDLQKYHRPTWDIFVNFHDKVMLELMENNLRRGVAEGWYREDLNVPLIARFHVNLMRLTTDAELFPLKQFTTLEILHTFMRYHLYAIVSDKGRAQAQEFMNKWLPTQPS